MKTSDGPLDDQLAALSLGDALGRAQVVILPDRIVEYEGSPAAAFRAESQALRIYLQEAGYGVELVTPDGARKVTVEEHDASLVLPAVLTSATVPANVVSTLIANWLSSRMKRRHDEGHRDNVKVRYREVEFDVTTGKGTVCEICGDADDVIHILRDRGE